MLKDDCFTVCLMGVQIEVLLMGVLLILVLSFDVNRAHGIYHSLSGKDRNMDYINRTTLFWLKIVPSMPRSRGMTFCAPLLIHILLTCWFSIRLSKKKQHHQDQFRSNKLIYVIFFLHPNCNILYSRKRIIFYLVPSSKNAFRYFRWYCLDWEWEDDFQWGMIFYSENERNWRKNFIHIEPLLFLSRNFG